MCLQIYVYSYVSLLYIYKLRYVIVCVYLDMIKQLRTGLRIMCYFLPNIPCCSAHEFFPLCPILYYACVIFVLVAIDNWHKYLL